MRKIFRLARKMIIYGLIGFQFNAIVIVAGLVKKIAFPKAFIYCATVFGAIAIAGFILKIVIKILNKVKRVAIPLATTFVTHI